MMEKQISITTVWADGFKSSINGDAATACRKTMEALRRGGVPVTVVTAPDLRDIAYAVSRGEVQDNTGLMQVGRCTLIVKLEETV